jgi:addiction module HigA family antidote
VADHLGITRQALDNLVNERDRREPEMALRIGKLCGNGPDFWLNLQKEWDLAEARKRLGGSLEAIPTLAA